MNESLSRIVWNELETLRIDYESRGFEIDRLHRKIEGIKQSAGDYKARCRMLASSRDAVATTLNEVQKELDALRQARAQERGALPELHDALKDTKLALADELRNEVQRLQQAVKERDSDLVAQDKEIEGLRRQMEEYRTGHAAMQEQLREAGRQLADARERPPAYKVQIVDGSNTGSIDGYEVVNAATGERVDAWLRSKYPRMSLEDCERYAEDYAERENEAVNRGGQ